MEENKENQSAEKDSQGKEYLSEEPWQKMGTDTLLGKASAAVGKFTKKVVNDFKGEDGLRVIWLSTTLFFTVGGYWLLRSIKDPIISIIDGVDRIPQAKIASLIAVFALVVIYNKMLDIFPKHHLFYIMGTFYGALFFIIALLLQHPTIGLPNTNSDPYRLLGWVSYVGIESFGSMVIQCYWALVNASVDVKFAKKYFGIIVAGAQIGSILGPTVATQAEKTGIPPLYMGASACMFFMVIAMYFYVQRFGTPVEDENEGEKVKEKEGGVLEGFKLFLQHDYVKGLFAVSCMFNIQVTVIDYMMKVLAKSKFELEYPDDPQAALRGFASFMGHFGQVTNSISFLFSLFGTGFVIKYFGLTNTLISFPVLLLACTVAVWMSPTIWVVFGVMMIIKGMSYALNNPTKEILYQMTSTTIKFKCKSWIETFGQRGAKAGGSIITNQFANNLASLADYGSMVGIGISISLIAISSYMGKKFEELSVSGQKIGEKPKYISLDLAVEQNETPDTSCGLDEEGQGGGENDSGSSSSLETKIGKV